MDEDAEKDNPKHIFNGHGCSIVYRLRCWSHRRLQQIMSPVNGFSRMCHMSVADPMTLSRTRGQPTVIGAKNAQSGSPGKSAISCREMTMQRPSGRSFKVSASNL
jgi:hypothetical protein